jgi:hypothetical protein
MRRNCKKYDKLRSVAEHPKGIVALPITIKVYKQIYWQCCNGLVHLLADDEMTNTLLPCSVGRVDMRITDAWIYSEAEKEAEQKTCAMRHEWLLLWEAEGC